MSRFMMNYSPAGLAGNLGDRWGAETSPSGFELEHMQAANEIAPGILDYAKQVQAFGESLFDTILRVRSQVHMTETQQALLDIQLQRAQQGLPPLATSTYTTGTGIAGLSTQALLLILGVGVLLMMAGRR